MKLAPPFRADHVGSLKRPQYLQDAREQLLGAHDASHNLGPHDNAALREIEDAAITEAVKLQESVGMRAITDGEFRRRNWWSDFIVALQNVDGTYAGSSGMSFTDAHGHKVAMPTIIVSGKIGWPGSVHRRGFEHLKRATKSGTPKVTLPAPQMIYYAMRALEPDVPWFRPPARPRHRTFADRPPPEIELPDWPAQPQLAKG